MSYRDQAQSRAKTRKEFHIVCNDIQPHRRILVNSGDEAFEQSNGIEVLGLRRFLKEVREKWI